MLLSSEGGRPKILKLDFEKCLADIIFFENFNFSFNICPETVFVTIKNCPQILNLNFLILTPL